MINSPANYIYGKHALREALEAAPKIVKKVFFARSMDDRDLRSIVKKHGITPAELKESKGSHIDSNVSHQGVVAQVDLERLLIPFDQFIAALRPDENTCLVLLDELNDPHNVGAIIRSAAAFGAAAVLVPPHRQAPITATVVKVSAGMAFKVPLVSIGNVNTTVEALKKRGFWVYGLAGEGATPISDEEFEKPTVLIMGNESIGIREKTREHCDKLLSIPINPRCESLNVAASAAVALSTWVQKHPVALN